MCIYTHINKYIHKWTASGKVYEKGFWGMGIEILGRRENHLMFNLLDNLNFLCIAFIMVKEQSEDDWMLCGEHIGEGGMKHEKAGRLRVYKAVRIGTTD